MLLLLAKIKRYKSLTIKDTIVYPLLLVMTFVLMIVARVLYVKVSFLSLIKDSFNDALNIIKLSFNADMIALLKAKNIVMLIAYYGTFVISFVALSSLTVYLLCITIKNTSRLLTVFFKGKEIILIFGFNEDAKKMIKYFKDEKIKMTVVLNSGVLNKYVEEKTFLDKHHVSFVECPYKEKEDYIKAIKATTKSNRKNYTIITFFSDDKTNEDFSTEAIAFLLNSSKKSKRNNVRFIMNVDMIQEHFIQDKIYDKESSIDITKGRLRTYNKYDLNSYIFNQNHTFAKYIHSVEKEDLVFIHPDCTVSGCDIHAYFIGFGRVNQSLLRDVLINNQFAEKCEADRDLFVLKRKSIDVDVYDERKKLNAFDLSNGLFKYDKSSFDPKKYLDLPEDYVSHIQFNLDTNIEDLHFINKIYNEIKERIEKKKNKQFNFFFVSLQSDMYNCLIANTIKKSIDSIPDSYSFYFVRKETPTDSDTERNNLFFICNDEEVFSHKNVLLNNVYNSAKYEHFVYSKGETIDQATLEENWNGLERIKQKSNLYAVNGLYFKKDLLNIDLGNYREKYNPNGIKPVGDDDIDRLTQAQKHFETIDVLAFIEHERWNAFELANGVLPMKISLFEELFKEKCKRSNQADDTLSDEQNQSVEPDNQTEDGNYHLCIASAKGLVEYYHLFKEKGSKKANVIKYDYDAMNNYLEHKRLLKTTQEQ